MNIDQLKYFADLAKTNSITNTAKRMFISQQALSESIKRLENELGCTLVNRSKTGVEFTDDGKAVLEYANKMLEQHKSLENHLQNKYNKNYLQGKLSIGVGPTVSNVFLPKLMLKMHRQYPDIKLHILEASRDAILSMLNTSDLDFGIFGVYTDENKTPLTSHLHKQLSDPQIVNKLQMQELYSDPMVCVLSQNHPLSVEKQLTRTQLDGIAQTNFSSEIDALSRFDNENFLCISTNARIHQQFILEENVICCMPYQAYISQFNDKHFTFRPIIDSSPVENYLFYRKSAFEENEILYTQFIEAAKILAKEL